MGKIITTGKVAFIGCGAMGEAILKGLLAANMTQKEEISVSLPTAVRRDYLAKEYGVKTFSKNLYAVSPINLSECALLCLNLDSSEISSISSCVTSILFFRFSNLSASVLDSPQGEVLPINLFTISITSI